MGIFYDVIKFCWNQNEDLKGKNKNHIDLSLNNNNKQINKQNHGDVNNNINNQKNTKLRAYIIQMMMKGSWNLILRNWNRHDLETNRTEQNSKTAEIKRQTNVIILKIELIDDQQTSVQHFTYLCCWTILVFFG